MEGGQAQQGCPRHTTAGLAEKLKDLNNAVALHLTSEQKAVEQLEYRPTLATKDSNPTVQSNNSTQTTSLGDSSLLNSRATEKLPLTNVSSDDNGDTITEGKRKVGVLSS